jgi:hypothetical protein
VEIDRSSTAALTFDTLVREKRNGPQTAKLGARKVSSWTRLAGISAT